MKTILIVIFCCFIAPLAWGQTTGYDTIRYARKHYQKRVSLFKRQPIKKGRVILLGNSITEFADWQKLLHDSTVMNRGIAGDNTFGVLERLEDVIARMPVKLFLEIGINDISQNIPVNVVVENISTIVRRVKTGSPATKIYVYSILPTNDRVKDEYPDAYHKNATVREVNKQLRYKAAKNGFTYIDLIAPLSDARGDLSEKYAQPDGLHLNDAGYKALINVLKMGKYVSP